MKLSEVKNVSFQLVTVFEQEIHSHILLHCKMCWSLTLFYIWNQSQLFLSSYTLMIY